MLLRLCCNALRTFGEEDQGGFLVHLKEALADAPSTHGECRLRQMVRLVPQNLHGCRNAIA